MKGRATLNVSKENLIEALQSWLDAQWTVDSPVVVELRAHFPGTAPGGVAPETYSIVLESNRKFLGVPEILPGGAGDPP